MNKIIKFGKGTWTIDRFLSDVNWLLDNANTEDPFRPIYDHR